MYEPKAQISQPNNGYNNETPKSIGIFDELVNNQQKAISYSHELTEQIGEKIFKLFTESVPNGISEKPSEPPFGGIAYGFTINGNMLSELNQKLSFLLNHLNKIV